MRGRVALRCVVAALAVGASVALVGCGPAPWMLGDGETPSPTQSVAPPVPNDLSSGSTERELTAGAVSAKVNYWSTLAMDRWTADALKPLSISLITIISPDNGQKVYLQRASMVAVPVNASKTFAALEAQTDAATVAPGYLVLDPYSYSQTFNVGAVDPGATQVTLQLTYDFLVQTTPTSKEYAKQTATDTVTVAIAPAVHDG